jgi:hypothetical protein
MFSALFSFLGGSVFRAIWGEASSWVTNAQDHKHEIEAMRLQSELDDKTHAREMDRLKVSSELNIKQIEVQSEGDLASKDADAFVAAMATINTKTGVAWVDAWNGCIRPMAASIALLLWVSWLWNSGFKPTAWDKELVGVILGFYFAHRVFVSKGK